MKSVGSLLTPLKKDSTGVRVEELALCYFRSTYFGRGLKGKCATAALFYTDDFDGAELRKEIEDGRMLVRTRRDTDIKTPKTPLELFKFSCVLWGQCLPRPVKSCAHIVYSGRVM
ncbi:hypothetical protein HOLleu_23562 [Holothuria leucospilota]|uniref:Uncharacterized protein n=1 Tax=Holothuria leucospilota TaxID=206669 RepID=A0A9Q1BV73_HOLLE|nr:hypothetical protein HOLleu_23562 [Holothuria leucospilota]